MSFIKTFCSNIVDTFSIISEMEASGHFEPRLTVEESDKLLREKLTHHFSHLYIIVVESEPPNGIPQDISHIYESVMTSMFETLVECKFDERDFVDHQIRKAVKYNTLGKAMYYRDTYHALMCLKSSVYDTITNRSRLNESREKTLNDFFTILKDSAKELKPFAEDDPSSTSSSSDSTDR